MRTLDAFRAYIAAAIMSPALLGSACGGSRDFEAICRVRDADADVGMGCVDPQPIKLLGHDDSGFVCCADGSVNRVGPGFLGSSRHDRCATDADCDGACVPGALLGVRGNRCVTGCRDSAECRERQSMSEPGTGAAECGLSRKFDGCSTSHRLSCREPEDTCRSPHDCSEYRDCIRYAEPTGDDVEPPSWQCGSYEDCQVGRPYRVDGVARRAMLRASDEWCRRTIADASTTLPAWVGADRRASQVDLRRLQVPADPRLRTRAGGYWGEAGRMEHASVASFARFVMHLMALGAPPDLIVEATRAAADEVEHARACFAVAAAYLGRPLGPAQFPLADCGAVDRFEFTSDLIAEGCVGESLAAAEAAHAADGVDDPTLRQLLQTIAADEARHAALAWSSLAWVLDGAAPALLEHARTKIAEAIAQVTSSVAIDDADPRLARYGVVLPGVRRNLALSSIRDIVLPLARELVGGESSRVGPLR